MHEHPEFPGVAGISADNPAHALDFEHGDAGELWVLVHRTKHFVQADRSDECFNFFHITVPFCVLDDDF